MSEDTQCCDCVGECQGHDNHADHDHPGAEQQDGALDGNIDHSSDETATESFSEEHTSLMVYSLAQMVDDIDNLSTWTGDSVTFSFPTEESDDYIGNSREGTLFGFNQEQADVGRDVIELFGDLIDLEFIDAGSDVDAEIRIYNSTLSGTAAAASAGSGISGDSWFYNYDPETNADRDFDPGSYYYHLFIHELGHVLGLSHTSFVSGSTYEERANYLQNNAAYSAMSYLTAYSAGLSWDTSYSSTPMLVDVAALQSIYGANMDTRTGDTVYGFNSNADRVVFDFDELMATYGEIGAITIWDAGGTDTLDVSKFADDGFIDLNDGMHSSVGGYDLNIAIADGAVIENATAGYGDDIVLGNEADNKIIGGSGADVLVGGDGNDKLYGEAWLDDGRDYTHTAAHLDGGEEVSYSVDLAGVTSMTFEVLMSIDPANTGTQWFGDLAGGAQLVWDGDSAGLWFNDGASWTHLGLYPEVFADNELHRLSIVFDADAGSVAFYFDGVLVKLDEDVAAGVFAPTDGEVLSFDHDGAIADIRIFDSALDSDTILADAMNTIDDTTEGLVSYVVFDETGGTDVISDTAVSVTSGAEFIEAEALNLDDLLIGGAGNDLLVGGVGADTLEGGSGADHLIGGAGADHLDGGDDVDRVDYRRSDTGVTIDLTQGTGQGGDAEGDTLVDIEKVTGSNHDDVIIGSAADDILSGVLGDDVLHGLKGRDRLFGNDGEDILVGGNGKDSMSGGDDSDTFVFDARDHTNWIRDFDVSEDLLAFIGAVDMDDLTITDTGSSTTVVYENTKVIVLNTDPDELTAANFDFGFEFA